MKKIIVINVAKDFSYIPAGRYKTDGPCSGEAFLEYILIPSLLIYDKVHLELDDTYGYSSAWLHEVFSNLLKKCSVSFEWIHTRLELVTTDGALYTEIWEYICGIPLSDKYGCTTSDV